MIQVRIQMKQYVMERLKSIGTQAALVASADLDQESVYHILEAIYSHQKRLHSAHPALASIDIAKGRQDYSGINRHPGVERFFAEH